jgi:hypothetical protein
VHSHAGAHGHVPAARIVLCVLRCKCRCLRMTSASSSRSPAQPSVAPHECQSVLHSSSHWDVQFRQCSSVPLVQDGYAVVSSDPPQEYEVAFESLAGTEQQTLQPGTIAYISTGEPAETLAWSDAETCRRPALPSGTAQQMLRPGTIAKISTGRPWNYQPEYHL